MPWPYMLHKDAACCLILAISDSCFHDDFVTMDVCQVQCCRAKCKMQNAEAEGNASIPDNPWDA